MNPANDQSLKSWLWCRPCTEDLPQIKQLYETHRSQGFEIVGVNVDSPGAPINEYIQQYQVPWPHIHEQGGLQSNIAQQYGVITLPIRCSPRPVRFTEPSPLVTTFGVGRSTRLGRRA